ncbi:TonB-dependent receptor plug domain-containing protein [Phenylobacterium deserti]|uniref:TonB-dependent receptor n=1 Tax=Phenylobacterium deserti TaxID=1914756 RepID=A0A328ADD7_9CAUL|nr:TonB-dependent receptor [Phenylobacterium deserti]RAK52236.1 TonB-dependent receptor [Phenylobacterium deserti]
MRYRVLLFAAASAANLLATAAVAQTQPADTADVEEVVVTGTRAQARSRLESLSPVDVVSARSLEQQGRTELAAQLQATVPSITFPRPSGTDATDAVRPLTLRGQGPDQTLVLINGSRAHSSAVLNTNGSVGRGSAAVDLNTIPSTAISHIEVLRDGASALYGSDAIAGVINILLREADHGGGASVTYGQYVSGYKGFYGGDRDFRDGQTVTVNGWQGLKLGSDGFLTVSAEYRDRDHTNRADVDPRFGVVTGRSGDGDVKDGSIYLNAGKPLAAGFEARGWAGYQHRDGQNAALYRTPTEARNIPSIYPNGFVPLINVTSDDANFGLGLRGDIAGWRSDFTISYGWNEVEYGVENTLNASFGPTSPRSFYAGTTKYDQLVGNADFSRDFDLGLAGPLNIAFGIEARKETYTIEAGEPGSYLRGPVSTAAPGSQGFTGFQPSNEVDEDRTNVGGYLALEAEVLPDVTVAAAVRQEHYSDFGDNTSGRVSARWDLSPNLAFRGSYETGFRAPSLQQQYYTNTAILFVNNVAFETGTYPSISPVGQALGGQPLEPETSQNVSLGFVFRAGGFELTADAYQIEVEDRIVLSETLQASPPAAANPNSLALSGILSPLGATAARFFLNGVDTRTRGLDVVAHYRIIDEQAGTFDLTAAGNINDFDVTRRPQTRQTLLPTPVLLFGRQATLRFEEGTPPWKLSLQGDWSRQNWGATVRTTFYGDVNNAGAAADASGDVHTGDRGVVDAELRYTLPRQVTLALGADNLFDTYPRQIRPANNTTGAFPFTSFSPFGFNGRFVYGRVALNW